MIGLFIFSLITHEWSHAQDLNPLKSVGITVPASVASPLSTSAAQAVPGGLSEKTHAQSVSELVQAQKSELKALDKQHQSELKGLKSSQKKRLAEWEVREKEARHLFCKDHQKGPDRRAYIQDFLKRREDLNHQMASEKDQLKRGYEERVKAMKQTQAEDLARLKAQKLPQPQ